MVRVDLEGVRRKMCAIKMKIHVCRHEISVNKCTVFRNVLLKYRDPQQISYAEHSTLNGMSSTHLSPRGQKMVRKRRHTTCKNQRGLRTPRRKVLLSQHDPHTYELTGTGAAFTGTEWV